MILDLVDAVVPEPALRLAEKKLVDEVNRCQRPAVRVLFDFGLLCEDLFADLLTVFSNIRSLQLQPLYFADHKFVSDDAHRKEIHFEAVVRLCDDLWCHIPGCPASICPIVRPPFPRNSQVCDSQIAALIEHQILRLDVPVHNPIGVHILKPGENARYKKLGLFFREPPSHTHMEAQVTAVDVVHNEVETLSVLEGVQHVHKEGMRHTPEQRILIHH